MVFSLTPLVKRLLILWGVLWLASFLSELAGFSLTNLLRLDPALLHGDFLRLPGVVTYALVHDPTGVLHVAFNAYLFAVFGPEVEVLFPGRRFIRFLLIATLAGAAVHLLLALVAPAVFGSAVVGGSGIVMAVIAANAAVYPNRLLNLIFLQCRLITFFLVLVGLDVLGFLAISAGRGGMVAADVHLAGAAAGWILAGGFQRFDNPVGRWMDRREQRHRQKEAQSQRKDEDELDRILAKISSQGMSSLSSSERRFLQRRSGK